MPNYNFIKWKLTKKRKSTILIGSLSKNNRGAIPNITKAFVHDLKMKYEFVPHFADRKFGSASLAEFNPVNVYYFLKHLFFWIGRLALYNPNIAHYPITSYWNLVKALVFLKIAKMLHAKTVGHLHGGAFDDFWKTLSKMRRRFATRELNQLDVLIVLSDGWKSWVCEIIGLEDEKVMVVNNPIEIEFEKRALSFKPAENPSIFFIGSLGKRKGVYDILTVASLLKERRIYTVISLAGPEAKRGNLREIGGIVAREQLDNVKVSKPLYGREKIEYFERNSIFLFPSYNENFPLVILEAAAAAKAIITSRVGALPEFFEHNESVIFVEPGNIDQIVNAVIELISDRNKRLRLGAGARKVFINKLSRDKIINSLDKVYQSILNRKV